MSKHAVKVILCLPTNAVYRAEGSGGFRERLVYGFSYLFEKILQQYRTSAFAPSKTRRKIVIVSKHAVKTTVDFADVSKRGVNFAYVS